MHLQELIFIGEFMKFLLKNGMSLPQSERDVDGFIKDVIKKYAVGTKNQIDLEDLPDFGEPDEIPDFPDDDYIDEDVEDLPDDLGNILLNKGEIKEQAKKDNLDQMKKKIKEAQRKIEMGYGTKMELNELANFLIDAYKNGLIDVK